ncbi:MAG: restriction endonuclease subunit S [Lentisphaerae bacterium]|jgi:type I restriction enzyme S subunit|nr:restriction endonuclease subunit S [Lentisphaerota bacterium]
MKTHPKIPKLRFPEFRKEGGWDQVTLGDIITLEYGISLPEKKRTGQGYAVVGSNGVVGFHEPAMVSGPVVVVGRKGSVGKINLFESDCTPIDTTFYVVLKSPNQNNFYFIWRLLTAIRLDSIQDIGAIPGLNRNTVYSQLVTIPGLAEQTKVADCFSSLDNLIQAEEKKLEALQTHKKGLMQNLFPRPGKTTPRLRFPQFRNVPFEFSSISKFARISTGKKDTKDNVANGQYPFFVRSQNIERINSYSYDGEAVLTSGDGVGVGKNFHYINGKFDFHQRVYCICKFEPIVNARFFFYYFSQHFRERVLKMSARNSVDSVRLAMISEMPIWTPHIDEQQQIASLLTTLDDQITAQTHRIQTLTHHKKGLLQQLFPTKE